MKSIKPFIILIVFAALFYFYFAVSFKPGNNNSAAPPLPPLKIACSAWPGFLPSVLASEKGYFKDAGVAVRCEYSQNIRQQLLDFGNGSYDGAGFALGSLISLYSKDRDFSVIMATDYSMGADALIANPPINSVGDLKGKTVLVNLGSYAELFIDLALERHSMQRSELTLMSWNDENAAVEKVLSKEADAAFLWEPYASMAMKNGARCIYSSRDMPGIVTDVFAFRNKTIKERPDDIKKFVECWFRAVEFWSANTAEASLLIARAIESETAAVSLAGIELCGPAANERAFSPGVPRGEKNLLSLYDSGKLYIDHYIKLGIHREKIKIEEILNPAFIKK